MIVKHCSNIVTRHLVYRLEVLATIVAPGELLATAGERADESV
jgi:hypothetical protein